MAKCSYHHLSQEARDDILTYLNETVNGYFEVWPQSNHITLEHWHEVIKYFMQYSSVKYYSLWQYKPQKVMIVFGGDIIELSSGDILEWHENDHEWSFRN